MNFKKFYSYFQSLTDKWDLSSFPNCQFCLLLSMYFSVESEDDIDFFGETNLSKVIQF